MKNMIFKYSLLLLIVISLFVRIWKISDYPHPPNGDEVAFGYYGWSLLHFGTDEYGNKFPMSFSSIGDYKYPGLAYINIIPAALFGLSDLTIRFWNVVSGVGLVILVYIICLSLFKKRNIALWSGLFAAFSPWSIIESRLGYENHISMVMVLAAFFLLFIASDSQKSENRILDFVKKHKKTFLITSFLLLIVSVFTYAAQRVFVPSMLALFVSGTFVSSKFKDSRKLLAIFFVLISAVVFLLVSNPQNRGRADEDIWKYSDKAKDRLLQIHVQAGKAPVKIPVLATRIFHNKYKVAGEEWLERYVDHFSPSFLFFNGEIGSENIPDMGLLLIVEIITLPLGLLYLVEKKLKSQLFFILGWLFISPIASSLTFGGAHMHRASNMIPSLAIISGLGSVRFFEIFSGKKRVLSTLIFFGLFVFSSLYGLNQIFVHMQLENPWKNDFVNKEMATKTLELRNNYKNVVVPDNDYIYFLFYGQISPQEFLENSIVKSILETRWERVDSIYNIIFKIPYNCPKSGKLQTLYVCKGEEVPQNSKIIHTIYYPDGVSAYNFIEFVPLSEMQSPLPELPSRVHYMVDVETNEDFPDGIIPVDYPSFW